MTEQALFWAYRNANGYAAQCACRGWIEADAEDQVAEAVLLHNQSPEHQLWRCEQDAVEALKRPARHECPCHDHGAA